MARVNVQPVHINYPVSLSVVDGICVDSLAFLNLQGGGMDVLRADTGVLLWRYTPRVPALRLSPLILIADGVVYVSTQDGHLNALRASDGKLLWSYNPHTAYKQLLPVVGNDIVLIALQDGSVEALRASSGSLLWRGAMNS